VLNFGRKRSHTREISSSYGTEDKIAVPQKFVLQKKLLLVIVTSILSVTVMISN
jgi:hypothetical protein